MHSDFLLVIFACVVLVLFSFYYAWNHDQKFYDACHEAGGVVLNGDVMYCVNPSALIELKE